MAPRTRSNRIEHLAKEKLLASGRLFNDTGLPALPDELYLEIISYFPSMPVPTESAVREPEAFQSRQITLFALSQTCRSLRNVCLRYLYQRVEVYEGMVTNKGPLPKFTSRYWKLDSRVKYIHKQYAEELVRQLEIVTIRDPSLAQYVNILNVVIPNYSPETVVAELARCMALLPNLHTVQLISQLPYDGTHVISSTFRLHQYPQIRNACIVRESAPFLSACPNVQSLSLCMNASFDSDDLPSVIKLCPHLKRIGKFSLNSSAIRLLVKNLRNLNDVTLVFKALTKDYDYIALLSNLPLHTIRMFCPFKHDVQEKRLVSLVQKVLAACPKTDHELGKRVLFYRLDGTVRTFRP